MDHIDVRSFTITNDEVGTVAGALEELVSSVIFDLLDIHTHKATQNEFVTGQFSFFAITSCENDIGSFSHFVVGGSSVNGNIILVDAGVHEFAETDLLEFAYAVGTTGTFTGGGEGGQQHGSQNRNDSDYHSKCGGCWLVLRSLRRRRMPPVNVN